MIDTTTAEAACSGRFVLRIPPALHATLRENAQHAGLSLNEYAQRKLMLSRDDVCDASMDLITRATSAFGSALVGIVVFGSWTREEQHDGSDVDVMLVLEARVALTRALYRDWDQAEVHWGAQRLEAHLVHLPQAGAPVGAVWAEVAIDGLILLDRDLSIARHLAGIRRMIADGELVRRRTHGQSYWVSAA